MKKILTILLAALLTVGLTVPAFAAASSSHTGTEAVVEHQHGEDCDHNSGIATMRYDACGDKGGGTHGTKTKRGPAIDTKTKEQVGWYIFCYYCDALLRYEPF